MSSKKLLIYAVYDHPEDHPDSWVVREWSVYSDTHPLECKIFATLDEARESLPPGLALLERNEDDDPVIFETWI